MTPAEKRQATRIAAWTLGVVFGIAAVHLSLCTFGCGTSLWHLLLRGAL